MRERERERERLASVGHTRPTATLNVGARDEKGARQTQTERERVEDGAVGSVAAGAVTYLP